MYMKMMSGDIEKSYISLIFIIKECYMLSVHFNCLNFVLGVKKRDSSCPVRSCITCGNNRECSKVLVSTCECPCISRLDFYYCRNEFPASK